MHSPKVNVAVAVHVKDRDELIYLLRRKRNLHHLSVKDQTELVSRLSTVYTLHVLIVSRIELTYGTYIALLIAFVSRADMSWFQ